MPFAYYIFTHVRQSDDLLANPVIIICIKNARVNTDAKISLIIIKNLCYAIKKKNSSETLKKSKN